MTIVKRVAIFLSIVILFVGGLMACFYPSFFDYYGSYDGLVFWILLSALLGFYYDLRQYSNYDLKPKWLIFIPKIFLLICLVLIIGINLNIGQKYLLNIDLWSELIKYKTLLNYFAVISMLGIFFGSNQKEQAEIYKLPILKKDNSIITFLKENLIETLIVSLAIIIFSIIKIPYFEYNFTGAHTMKYNSYVEPAIYMAEHDNPLWYQKKYIADPIHNPEGIFKSFGNIPILEWGLMTIYLLLPNLSTEFSTRLFMHIVGILVLLTSYFFLRRYFPKSLALVVLCLISINPIYIFATYVTVIDSVNIVLMFCALIFLGKYFTNSNYKYLFWSGILFGIGNAMKINLLIWQFPITFLMIYSFKKVKNWQFLLDFSILSFISILPTITRMTAIRFLPSDIIFKALAILGMQLFGYYLLYILLVKKQQQIINLFLKFLRNKSFLIPFCLVICFLIIFFIKKSGLLAKSNDFLTDTTLVANSKLYFLMFYKQFRSYLTNDIFNLSIFGFLLFLFARNKNIIKIILSFFTGALFYWIVASKVIFFHPYYTLIILFCFLLFASYGIYVISYKLYVFEKIIYLVLIFILVTPSLIKSSQNRLSIQNEGFDEAARYLKSTTQDNEMYIDQGYLLSLTLKTGISRVGSYEYLETDEVRKMIKDLGFANAMNKLGIKYLITNQDEPDYNRLLSIFTSQEIGSGQLDRTKIIISELNNQKQYYDNWETRNRLINEMELYTKFRLKNKIGNYNFFVFQN